jgi:hypothetical protein
MPIEAAASRSWFGTSISMSSVVRTTTGMTMTASATAPASPEKWPIRGDHDLVDEQADTIDGALNRMSLMNRTPCGRS